MAPQRSLRDISSSSRLVSLCISIIWKQNLFSLLTFLSNTSNLVYFSVITNMNYETKTLLHLIKTAPTCSESLLFSANLQPSRRCALRQTDAKLCTRSSTSRCRRRRSRPTASSSPSPMSVREYLSLPPAEIWNYNSWGSIHVISLLKCKHFSGFERVSNWIESFRCFQKLCLLIPLKTF